MEEPPPQGTIDVEREHGVWVLTLRGEHDIATRPTLGDEITRALDAGSQAVIDLTHAEFFDSSVIAAIVAGIRRADQGPNDDVVVVVPGTGTFADRLIEISGLRDIARVYPTRGDAVAALTGER